jgi:DNA-binding protein Fis
LLPQCKRSFKENTDGKQPNRGWIQRWIAFGDIYNMVLAKKKQEGNSASPEISACPKDVAENILEKNLEDITSILFPPEKNKSRIYDEVVDMMDRALIRIALRRTNHIKSAAASYLGINRNTLQKKIAKLGIGEEGQ